MAVIPRPRRPHFGRHRAVRPRQSTPSFRMQRAIDTARARGESGAGGFSLTAAFLIAGILIIFTMLLA